MHNQMPAKDIIPAKKSLHALHTDDIQLRCPVDPSTPPFSPGDGLYVCNIYQSMCGKRGVCTGDLQRCRPSDRVVQGDTTWHKALFSLRLVS